MQGKDIKKMKTTTNRLFEYLETYSIQVYANNLGNIWNIRIQTCYTCNTRLICGQAPYFLEKEMFKFVFDSM